METSGSKEVQVRKLWEELTGTLQAGTLDVNSGDEHLAA